MKRARLLPISFVLFVPFVDDCLLHAGPTKSPRFTIETPSESRGNCTLVALDDKGLELEDAGTRVKVPRFVELRQAGKSLPPLLAQIVLALTTGDRIALDPS